jgi:hypothetical protein
MNPHQFIAQGRDSPLSERAGVQAFFLVLYVLLVVSNRDVTEIHTHCTGSLATMSMHRNSGVIYSGMHPRCVCL